MRLWAAVCLTLSGSLLPQPSVAQQAPDTADLALSKTGTGVADSGDTLRFTITVRNLGPDAATGVFVADTLPLGSTFLSADQNGVAQGGVVRWPQVASLAPTDPPLVYRIEVLAPGVGGFQRDSVFNIATVTSATFDPDSTNNVAIRRIIVEGPAPDPNLNVVKSGPDSVGGGDTFTYTITLTNPGPGNAVDVVLTDSLPDAGSVVAISGNGRRSGREITWPTIRTFEANSAPRIYTVTYSAPSAPDTLVNVARVRTRSNDPDTTDNRSETVTEVVDPLPLQLAIDKTGPGSVIVGDTARFTIRVTNTGPRTLTQLQVWDTLPPIGPASFVRASHGASPSPSGGRFLQWPTVASLAPGADTTFWVTMRLNVETDHVNRAFARAVGTDPVTDPHTTTAVGTPSPIRRLGCERRTGEREGRRHAHVWNPRSESPRRGKRRDSTRQPATGAFLRGGDGAALGLDRRTRGHLAGPLTRSR